MNGKLKKLAFGGGVVLAILMLALALPMTYGAMAISSIVVDVLVPDATGKLLVTHYEPGNASSTATVMTETDVRKIKGALSKTRALFGFYNSGIVTIESPTSARAVFWRRNTLLQVLLVKAGLNWEVTKVMEGSAHHVAAKDIWSRMLDAASTLAP